MKKQELIHLHGLLAQVADYCDEEGVELDLENYRKMDIHPMSINISKGSHEEAVLVLASELAASIESDGEETVARTAD